MALFLTSREISARAQAGLQNPGHFIPGAAAAGGALIATTLLKAAKPGRSRTTLCFAAMGVGAAGSLMVKDKIVSNAALGVAAGGLWSLFSRD